MRGQRFKRLACERMRRLSSHNWLVRQPPLLSRFGSLSADGKCVSNTVCKANGAAAATPGTALTCSVQGIVCQRMRSPVCAHISMLPTPADVHKSHQQGFSKIHPV